MNVADVMQALADQLDTIAGLRIYAFPADNVQVPAAVVGYPEVITYDVSMGRGVDQMDVPVFLVVARQTDRTARAELGPFLDGSGAKSVKAVLEAGTYTAMASVRVGSAVVDVMTVAGVDHLVGVFSVDVFGTGD